MRNRTAVQLVVAAGALAAVGALYLGQKKKPALRALYDYRGRSGFPRGTAESRGIAKDVARDALKWLARPGGEVLPTSRVRAVTTPQPAAPQG
ncbi:MAG TPA: hypothetical protein VG873_18035 [Burkholderiales bacterium]|nr:hypothetical protein [Burkholderiales bacterium]